VVVHAGDNSFSNVNHRHIERRWKGRSLNLETTVQTLYQKIISSVLIPLVCFFFLKVCFTAFVDNFVFLHSSVLKDRAICKDNLVWEAVEDVQEQQRLGEVKKHYVVSDVVCTLNSGRWFFS